VPLHAESNCKEKHLRIPLPCTSSQILHSTFSSCSKSVSSLLLPDLFFSNHAFYGQNLSRLDEGLAVACFRRTKAPSSATQRRQLEVQVRNNNDWSGPLELGMLMCIIPSIAAVEFTLSLTSPPRTIVHCIGTSSSISTRQAEQNPPRSGAWDIN
jgi:hypothetical protein